MTAAKISLECYCTTARGYVQTVVDALGRVPGPIDRLMGERGVSVFVDRRWTDIWPDWDPEESGPSGDGYNNWAECSAFYREDSRRVYMVEEMLHEGEYHKDTDNALPTLMHELGHALDLTSDPRPSQDPDFRSLYLEEREAAKEVEILDYYTWHWTPGAIEAFATAFAAGWGPIFPEEDGAFREHFNGCIYWVRDYLDELGALP